MIERIDVTIVNKRGLHARASSRFVKTAEDFSARITVSKDGTTVGGSSIMGLMLLAASPGSTIEIAAEGEDAKQALAALVALIENRFDEDE